MPQRDDTRTAAPAKQHSEVYRDDGWTNLLTGLGSRVDKSRGTVSLFDRIISDEELEATYLDDGLGSNIVNMMPEDMFREGWEYSFPEMDELKAKEIAEEYSAVMETIGGPEKLEEGVSWARLYGGAIALIGALDGGDLEKQLRPGRIRTFEYLRIIDRTDIAFDKIEFQFDPLKPRYGLPEYYPVSFKKGKGGIADVRRVHFSRVIEIHGERVPAGATHTLNDEQRYWGVSVLQRAYRRLEILGSSIGSVGALLNEVSVGKYKFKDLADILAMPNGDQMIKKRVELMDLCKSVFRSMYFDAGGADGKGAEDFIRDSIQFGGVDAVLYIIMMLVSADTGYPITRLFGVSPAGMNATGESDMRNYYDKVRSRQHRILKPMVLRLVQIISEWKKLPEPYIEFKPLKQLSEKEQVELEKSKAEKDKVVAETYKTYIDMGAMEPYQARFLQFGDSLDKIPVPEEEALPQVETVEDDPDNNNSGKAGSTDKPGDPGEIKARMAELEEKKELTEEEQKELEELKKQLEEEKKER
jgi:phage-related protein (TIGR01555 family)